MLENLMGKLERSVAVEAGIEGLCVVRVSKPGQKTYAVLREGGKRLATCRSATECIGQSGESEAPVLFDADTSPEQYVETAFVGGAWRKVTYEHGRRYVFMERAE